MDKVKNIKYDYKDMKWIVTINDKYEGESFFVFLAFYKALMLAVANNFEE